MYGFQLVRLFEGMRDLGLVSSREDFSRRWCQRNPGYLRDYMRRDGATSRVSARTIERLRIRLAEAGTLLRQDLGDHMKAFDDAILRDLHVADLLARRSIDARCP